MGRLWRVRNQSYKGMEMGLAPGTHEAALDLLLAHVEHRSGVLDLGARTGAFLAGLRDAGFSDLCAVDLDVGLFRLPDVPLHRIDLNSDFADGFDRRFKLIVSSDVIEHLDSPRHFLEQAGKLLDDDGHILITMPNIAYWVGRVKFLLTGEHWGFGERNYRVQRHVSPMTHDQFRLMLAEIGFRPVADATAGSFSGPLRRAALAPAEWGFRLACGLRARGESAIYLAAKAPEQADLKRPSDYRSWEEAGASGSA